MNFNPFKKNKPLVSVLRIEGIIQSGGISRPNLVNDVNLSRLIERAFYKGKPKAVALVINSPGGSPVQASLIGARIRRMASETEIPVYAFVEDLAASGGYWISAAADKIYADSSSIVGSIGVISVSFGFHEMLNKFGIERRLYTSGDEKSLLDPFLPQKEEDVKRLKDIQEQIHNEFIQHVKESRGSALQGDDLFSGRFWLGRKALELGLIDGIGHLVPTMKQEFGDKVRFRVYKQKGKLFSGIGIQAVDSILESYEERALRSRYGC